MASRVMKSFLVLCVCQLFSRVLTFPVEAEKNEEGPGTMAPPDLFRIKEEAKVLLERDPKLKPHYVAIIHHLFPHPTFPGESCPWFQVYVYSDFYTDMTEDERKKYTQEIIKEKLFEAGFHRVSFNCLTMEEENETYRPPEDELGGPTKPTSAESVYEGPMMRKYREVLEKNFKLHHIEVLDTSDNYHLPGNSEKFLTILMVSDQFQNKTEYEREQMVVNALKKDMPWDVRGLALILTSRYEYEHLPDSNTKNKMKKFAAMVHTKQLIIQSGYRNVTTTLHPMVHFSRIAELGERMYGSRGDENLEDNSKINEEERQMAWDYHEYNEERVAMNDKYYMKRLEQMRIDREKDIAERSKNDTLLREGRKLWTLTSYEKGLQEFSDEKKRFKFNLDGDFDYATTIAQFYHDQFNGEITRLRA